MKKPKQRLEQKLVIPEDLSDQLRDIQKTSEYVSIAKCLLMITDFKDVNKQVSSLKKAIDEWKKLLPDSVGPAAMAIFTHVLCYIFMDCDAKNPCRRTIASFFQSLHGFAQEQALEYLNKAMVDVLMNTTRIPDAAEKTAEDVNFRKHVDTVCSLLENFGLGERCVSMSVIHVLKFLVVALESQVVRESLVGTPALQTAAMLDCLVTIKATMNVLQKCKEEIADEINKDDTITCLLQRFVKVIVKILKNDSFFPDCRSAAGMAFALVVRTCTTKDTVIQVTVSLFFPTHMKKPISNEEIFATHWILNSFERQNIPEFSGFSYLSICRGVTSMLTRDSLVASEKLLNSSIPGKPGNLLIDVLFPEVTSLCLRLKDSSSLVALRTLGYWTGEVRQCISDSAVDDSFKSRMRGNSEIIQTLLNFVWSFWDHPLEALRYHTREIFDNAVKIHITESGNVPTCDTFVTDLSRKLCEINMFVRGKYGPLCCLVDVLGSQAMLEIHPSIPEDLMSVMTDQTVVPHAMEFAEKMFISHLHQMSKISPEYLNDWFELWVVPALRYLSSREKHVRKHISEYYIPALLKCCPECLNRIVQKLHEPEKPSEEHFPLDNVRCLVTCLKTARHLGLLPRADILSQEHTDTNGLWLGSISVAVLEKALCHLDDEVRSDVLGLICDSVRTTEPLTAGDLELLRKFYPVNMNSQSPSFRQRVLAMTKKLFIRLKDGGRSWKKKITCGEESVELDVFAAQVKLYVEFHQWFVKLQFQSLFPGASFARRTTALQNLQLISLIYPGNREKDPYTIYDVSEIFTSQTVHILLDCTKDTYDINKQMAFDLLVSCPASIHPFQDLNYALKWTATATQYAISPKAINVSTAACMFKVLIRKSPHKICLPANPENFNLTSDQPSESPARSEEESGRSDKENESDEKVSSITSYADQLTLREIEEETSIPCTQAFRVLSQFVTVMKSQIKVARKSLLQAAFDAPIHGVLYCIREIICDLELSDVAGNNKWQRLVTDVLQICYDVTDVVSPVVTNSSPEGNLCDNGGIEDVEMDKEFDNFAPKAQILLVCCWRAMKEVSLLLGEITKRAPVKEKDKTYGLLCLEQFDEIGQLFTNMLLTSKHRGAYELAHEGFVKLCHMLWRCEQREIQRLPELFLSKLLSDISSDNPTPWLCGTRRSAGLPFFFKAIVTTEPHTTGKCCFKSVMKELLNTAAKPVNAQDSNKDTTLPQVHARNILRALYKETKLGEDVFPYVADGVQVAVEGFLSESWAVRNSSTLLFSALMNRIFGPQSFQEEKRRQGMTGREFFSRFPSLHSFLVEQLEISLKDGESENITSIQLHPSLYPVLLLLSRLHPSAMDGNDSTLNMAAFLPYVLRCSKSCVLKTRAMAARALVPLVSGVELQHLLKNLIESLPQTFKQRYKQNQVHGCLLQIRELLNNTATNVSLSSRTKEDIYTSIAPLLSNRAWLASSVNPCDISRAVFLSILRLFIIDHTWFAGDSYIGQYHSDNSSAFYSTIEKAIEEIMNNECPKQHAFSPGRTLVKEEIARIALHPLYGVSSSNNLNTIRIVAFLFMPEYEVNLVALEYLHGIFLKYQDFSLTKENLDRIVRELLKKMLESTMKGECLAMLYKCLSHVPQSLSFPWLLDGDRAVKFHEGWTHVVQSFKSNRQRSDVMCSLLHLSSVLIKELHQEAVTKNTNEHIGKMADDWISFVETCAKNEESETLRLTVSQVLGTGNVAFILGETLQTFENLTFRLWKVIVLLLIDDSVEVKVSMASALSNMLQSLSQGCLRNYSVHSFLALKYSVRTPLELFWLKHPSLTLQWLLDLLDNIEPDIGSDTVISQDAAHDDMKNIDKLFEKGPANTHREDCMLAEIVFDEFVTWIEKNEDDNSESIPELLKKLANFVKTQVANYGSNRQQDSVYHCLYSTGVGLAMMKVLNKNTNLTSHCGKDSEAGGIFCESLQWIKELRKLDSEQCFYHFQLDRITRFVLEESASL